MPLLSVFAPIAFAPIAFAPIAFAPIAFATLHWGAAQTYVHFCTPPGLYGYLVTFFNVANPTCSYALQVMEMSKYFYNQSWIFIGMSTLGACKYLYQLCTRDTHKNKN